MCALARLANFDSHRVWLVCTGIAFLISGLSEIALLTPGSTGIAQQISGGPVTRMSSAGLSGLGSHRKGEHFFRLTAGVPGELQICRASARFAVF